MTAFEAPDSQGLLGKSRDGWRQLKTSWKRFWRLVAYYLPKGLYGRSLLIVITPMIILQSVVAFVFMERHWQLVTERLSAATARDVSAVVDLLETYPTPEGYANTIRMANEQLSLRVDVVGNAALPAPQTPPLFSILDQMLSDQLSDKLKDHEFWLDTTRDDGMVEIRVKLGDETLRIFTRRSQTYASNSHITLVWMVGTAIVLLSIAIAFLRNQVKPISQLAAAAESFGKGRPTPNDFRPRGAAEVRRAGFAFNQMRERIERQMEQRTAMLTGVSHDLRTILTRFRLQLAMGRDFVDTDALNRDVDDMQSMLQGYMDFAKGETREAHGEFDMEEWLARIEDEAELRERKVTTSLRGDPIVHVRPNAFGRLLNNVTGNAFRYAKTVNVEAAHTANFLTVTVDDDGPGVPADRREDVFKPFVRLDEARNQDSSGTGLGLSIARDIARSHGGDIRLEDGPLGGLRAVIRLPA